MFPFGVLDGSERSLPAPTIVSCSNVATTGGTGTIGGTNFTSTDTISVDINGTITPLITTYVSSTVLDWTLASGTYTAGTWTIAVEGGDGSTASAPIFIITSVSNPQTIFGANLKAQWIASNSVTAGGNIVSVPDSSGNSNALTLASVTPPTLVVADSRYLMSPDTILMNGTNNYLACVALSLGTGGTLYVVGAVDMLTSGTVQAIAAYNTPSQTYIYANANHLNSYLYAGGSSAVTTLVNLFNAPATIVAGYSNTSGNTTATAAVNNGTEADGSPYSYTIPNLLQLTLGASYNGTSYTSYANFAWPEICVLNAKPSSMQSLQFAQYMNLTYGITNPPQVSGSSIVPAGVASAPLRLNGSNFMTGVTVQIIVSGTPQSCTVTSSSGTIIDCTTPSLSAGVYDVTVTNPDGRSKTFVNSITVVTAGSGSGSAIVAWLMNNFGLSIVGLFFNSVTLNGSNVSAWLDLSGMANNMSQATSTAQPPWNAADSTNMHGQPSITPNGSTDYLSSAAFSWDSSAPGIAAIVITKQITSVTNEMVVESGLSGGAYLPRINSKTPQVYYNGTSKNWTGSISGLQAITSTIAAGANPNLTVAVANGTPQSTTSTLGAPFSPTTMSFFSVTGGSSQFSAQPVGLMLFFNVIPGSTALSNFETFAQGVWGIT